LHPNAQPLEEARRQLALLLEQQESLTPGLYRDLALYLQVLREVLLPAVQQACFHLATQVVPERYGQLPQERRQQFQQRLRALVQRCTALLTVEQLMGLAAQQQRRQHRRLAAEHQRLLAAFLDGRGASASGPTESTNRSTDPGTEPSMPAAEPAPGSVSLGLDLPVSADLLDAGIPGLAGSRPATAAPDPDPPDPAGSGAAGAELKLLQSLFSLAAEGMALESGHAEDADHLVKVEEVA